MGTSERACVAYGYIREAVAEEPQVGSGVIAGYSLCGLGVRVDVRTRTHSASRTIPWEDLELCEVNPLRIARDILLARVAQAPVSRFAGRERVG